MANQSDYKRDKNANAALGIGPGAGSLFSRKTLRIILISLTLLVIGIVWLISVTHPLPPHTITMATGPEGSTYAYWGKRYKILLAKEGIDLVLKPTAGGVENLNLLRDPKSGIQLGFVEGGVAADTDSPALVSLGTLGYEPVWFFSRKIVTDRILFALQGKRVSVGPEKKAPFVVADPFRPATFR